MNAPLSTNDPKLTRSSITQLLDQYPFVASFFAEEEVDFAAAQVISAVKKLRELSPLYEMVQEGIDLSTVNWTGH